MRKHAKFKLTVVLIVLFALSVALGMTLATATRTLEQRANNFTVGNIDIDLTEPGWDELDPEDKVLYPGRTVVKDPKITNTGDNDLYAYIEVVIPRAEVRTVNADEEIEGPQLQNLFSFTVNPGWELIESELENDAETRRYAYTAAILQPGDSTAALFDGVTWLNLLEGEIAPGTLIEIPVTAYAIQSGYLNETGATVKDKMVSAYEIYKTQAEQ